jgi:hypothetical protein
MHDTTHAPGPKRKRRGRRKSSQKPCAREGCHGKSSPPNGYCSFVCKVIASELDKAQRICEALGAGGLTSDLWTEAVALSDCWTRYLELDRRLYRAAVEVGITDEQWTAIKDGTSGSVGNP